MVVVMKRDATEADIERVSEKVRDTGGEAFVSRGAVHTIIGLVGDTASFMGLGLDNFPGVDHLIQVGKPVQDGGQGAPPPAHDGEGGFGGGGP